MPLTVNFEQRSKACLSWPCRATPPLEALTMGFHSAERDARAVGVSPTNTAWLVVSRLLTHSLSVFRSPWLMDFAPWSHSHVSLLVYWTCFVLHACTVISNNRCDTRALCLLSTEIIFLCWSGSDRVCRVDDLKGGYELAELVVFSEPHTQLRGHPAK